MKTNIVIDISSPIPYLTNFWFLSYEPKCCWPVKLKNSLTNLMFLCNIFKKVLQLLLCSIVMQNIQIYYGGSVEFAVTCYMISFLLQI